MLQVQSISFLQGVLFICLGIFPLVWLPWQLVWLYGQLLWLLEPFLLVAEVVLAQNVVMRIGQNMAERIDQDYDEATIPKVWEEKHFFFF